MSAEYRWPPPHPVDRLGGHCSSWPTAHLGPAVRIVEEGGNSESINILQRQVEEDHFLASHSHTHFPPGCTYTDVCGALSDFNLGTTTIVEELLCEDKKVSLCANSREYVGTQRLPCEKLNKQIANLKMYIRQPCTNTWHSPTYNFTDTISSEGTSDALDINSRGLNSVNIARLPTSAWRGGKGVGL